MSQDLAKLEQLHTLMKELEKRTAFSGIREQVNPYYPWQHELLYSSAHNAQTLLMAANRVGKSWIGARNLAYHLTGLYPKDWKGHKWTQPIRAWAAGVSAESTRDILQNELLGTPEDPEARGTGAIPLDCIGLTTRKAQVPNAIATVLVKHHTNGKFDGWSKLDFKAYEQGDKKFMGTSQHEIWLDEQPPDTLFGQCITRTANTGGHLTMTFTPEDGMTEVVFNFLNRIQKGQALIQATWDDAPHLTDDIKQQLLSAYGEHERDMRSKGIPVFGSGPVFTVAEEHLKCDPFEIPEYWPAIAGLDFGWDHPTAVVWLRLDPDSNTVYVCDTYKQRISTVSVHAAAINARSRCPVVWPHDGMTHDKGSGVTLADQYRQMGVQMLPQHFANPPAIGDGPKGNAKVEPGINALNQAMQEGRFKVFSTCTDWFEEYRLYHRDEGKIVAIKDDLMSATRYAFQSLRFAEKPNDSTYGYNMGFSKALQYDDLGIV